MDDILREIHAEKIMRKLEEINSLHPALKFTLEIETGGLIAFLDMLIQNLNGRLSSTWYSKPTDTGLLLNYHSLAPRRYKRSVVAGFVHRIYRACSSWKNIHTSLEKATAILEHNQYPPTFYQPIIRETLNKLIIESKTISDNNKQDPSQQSKVDKCKILVQYRGKITEDFC